MNEVQWDVLDALLQMLLGKGLISRTVYDKSHEKILGTLDFPPFFWDNEAGKEDVYAVCFLCFETVRAGKNIRCPVKDD